MKRFAQLYTSIDETNRTSGKVDAIVDYLKVADPAEAAWAIHFLVGRRPKRTVNSTRMQELAAALAGIPSWLFTECYDAVGDLAETVSLVIPEDSFVHPDHPLSYWVEARLARLATLTESEQITALKEDWMELGRSERFVYTKLITGAFRVGVSQELVVRAISKVGGIPAPVVSHRLMGDWQPTAAFYQGLLTDESSDTDVSRPYPFCLAHPLEGPLASLGAVEDWQIEWKWDGIRAQVIRREGQLFIWSRGEELITDRFPEVVKACESLPNGTVLDGEILAWEGDKPQKFMALQRRIGRKTLTKKILEEVPVVFIAFDLLENAGVDLRTVPLRQRREQLEMLINSTFERDPKQLETEGLNLSSGPMSTGALRIAVPVTASSWEEVAEIRDQARDRNVEGFMLKRKDSPYLVGRKKGLWWKWKIDPLTVDAVLIYAQRGSGKRASLYTDYTFAVWDEEGKLVPFAKAYSGLTDEEIRKVDAWVRRKTKEKFGPVRTVEPELVMELAFEGIQISSRHKSGIAVRFPRISRWRHDKLAKDADSLASIKALLNS